jgi:secreted PhoX family phosphatase
MQKTNISRRTLLNWAGALPATPLIGSLASAGLLTACGGGSTAAAASKTLTGITFANMAAPTATADRATTFTNAAVSFAYSDASIDSKTLAYKEIYKTGTSMNRPEGGTAITGGYYDINGNAIIDTSGTIPAQFYSDCPDGTSLLKLSNPTVTGVSGNVLFHVAQFEYKTANAKQGEARPGGGVYNVGGSSNGMYGLLPSQIGVTTLSQDKTTGALTPVYYHAVDTSPVHGLWITCASSLSPWNTHLSSEEYPQDAATIATGGQFQVFSQNLFGDSTLANPYLYNHVPEVTVHPDGTASIKKHYCMGRISREKVQVLPDNKTVIMGNDATSGGIFMFVADVAGNLSSGTLYAAQVSETDATKRAVGGAFNLSFIKLGHATSSQIEALAKRFFTNSGQTGAWQGIFASAPLAVKPVADSTYTTAFSFTNSAVGTVTVYTKPTAVTTGIDSTYSLINFGTTQQIIKFNTGISTAGSDVQLAAAFLETERYASYMGATMEFTKFEGVAYNQKDKKAYFAMSAIKDTMKDNGFLPDAANNALKLTVINSGATYEVVLGTDSTIGSDWVPKSMSVPTKLLGKDLTTADSNGNSADVDIIANVDNLWFSEATRTLFLGEDSGMHVNNYVWAYNVDTQTLSRIFSAPAGAECTGLQAVDNLNGFSYVMSNFQHPGDWESIHNTLLTATGSTLNATINTNWSNKDKAALGYMVLPAVGA